MAMGEAAAVKSVSGVPEVFCLRRYVKVNV